MLSQGKKNALEKSLENVLMPLLGKQVLFFFFPHTECKTIA